MPASQASHEKSLRLLTAIIQDDGANPLPAIAKTLGLPPSTAYRFAATFQALGFLSRASRGHYVAGPHLCSLAEAAHPSRILAATARPIIQALARATEATAHLGIWEGDMVTYIAKHSCSAKAGFTREGMQLEAYCSAIGKVLLAALPENERQRYLANGPFVALTENTFTDPQLLEEELRLVARQGFAEDREEIDKGLYCIAVPVRNKVGEISAAISISSSKISPLALDGPSVRNILIASAQRLTVVL